MDSWHKTYNARIKSAQWKNMKRDLIRMRGQKCEKCGSCTMLELHHKTYERLGKELTSDLELLCFSCHRKADQIRAAAGRARSAAALFEAGLDTYAEKKYGEDWADHLDHENISDEFDEWLESKRDWEPY
jgi:5-methylcytosine-specific restriction endonuclease McrA